MNNEKLQSLSPEEKAEIVKQVNTEVTSIAQEEERLGKPIKLPDAETLANNSAMALIDAKRQITALLPKMSKKAIHRATLAYLDLPTGDIPVYLKTNEEKMLFALGQRAIQCRFVIFYHHGQKLALEARMKKEQESKLKESEVPDGVQQPTAEQA